MSQYARLRSMLRIMLMIGVMPLPAVMKRSRGGTRSGRVNTPSTPPRRTMSPGFASPVSHGETFPESTSFGVIVMHPSGRSASEVRE